MLFVLLLIIAIVNKSLVIKEIDTILTIGNTQNYINCSYITKTGTQSQYTNTNQNQNSYHGRAIVLTTTTRGN